MRLPPIPTDGGAASRPWSLTRRMGVLFAITTSGLIALYGGWSVYFVLDVLRDDVKAFLEHEASEVKLDFLESDRSRQAAQTCLDDIARVTKEPPTAYRIRDARDSVVAESGPTRLLDRARDPIDLDASWRSRLFEERIAVDATEIDGTALRLEIIADARGLFDSLRDYASFAAAAFLVSVALAALAGWLAAWHGLRGLRQVVAHAADVDRPGTLPELCLDGAPNEVRAVGEALDAMLGRIARGLAEMRTFTAGLAHELRSPLQNLIGETEVTLLTDRPAEDYPRLLRSNLEDLHDLSDAVDNLVAYCRTSDAEVDALHPETFDLAAEADLRLARERRSAERKGVALVVETAGDTRLSADREGCLRVLRNLVGNAICWSPEASAVTVRIEGLADTVRLSVTDQGPGVPAGLEARIFEPFVSGPLKDGRRAGYGLGLAICRSVLAAHGGRLHHERVAPHGARFVAEFPRRRIAPITTPPVLRVGPIAAAIYHGAKGSRTS